MPGVKEVVFMGSKEIGYDCLTHLLDQQLNYNYRVVAVLTNERKLFDNEKSVKQYSLKNNIPVLNTPDELLPLKNIDILYSVQYHEILAPEIFKKATQIAVNLHMAPLPEYRGCNQFSFAILDKAREFGTTIHRLEEKADSGALLFEMRFPISEKVWVKELYDLTYRASLSLFKETLPSIIKADYQLTPQERLKKQRNTSCHYRNEIHKFKEINLNWDWEKIDRHIRATYFPPFEPPYTLQKGKKLYLSPEWLRKEKR